MTAAHNLSGRRRMKKKPFWWQKSMRFERLRLKMVATNFIPRRMAKNLRSLSIQPRWRLRKSKKTERVGNGGLFDGHY